MIQRGLLLKPISEAFPTKIVQYATIAVTPMVTQLYIYTYIYINIPGKSSTK